jgi:hypothetical protein
MSLDISMAIELEEAMMFGEAPLLNSDQQSILTMSVFDALNDINEQIKAQDLKEAKARMGEEAPQANKVIHHDETENFSGAMNDADALTTLLEGPHSPAVNHDLNWAGLFYEGEEDSIAEDQDSFTEHKTSSTVETGTSNDQTASPPDQTVSFSKETGLDTLDPYMLIEEEERKFLKELESHDEPRVFGHEFKDAVEQLNKRYKEDLELDDLHALPKDLIRLPPSSPSTSPTCDVQNSMQQGDKPVHQAKPAHLIHQPDLCLSQNNPDLQQGTKNAQGRAKKAARAFKTIAKSAPKTMFVDAQHVETSHVPQKVIADFQYYGQHEMMDGDLALESNEHSYIVPNGQSEHGLAGLIGLTLDQAKSGMRNKRAGVRNTMIEKPKVCLP